MFTKDLSCQICDRFTVTTAVESSLQSEISNNNRQSGDIHHHKKEQISSDGVPWMRW